MTAASSLALHQLAPSQRFPKGFTYALDLPTRGLILLTGQNGHGKSILLGSIPWALWGKTHRGARIETGEVQVVFDGLHVTRRRKKDTELRWVAGGETAEWATPTKNQKGLEQHIGTFERFRDTSVLTGKDAARFTDVTDKQRKEVMEELIPGFARFDPALALCKRDLKDATARMQEVERNLGVYKVQLEGEERQLQELVVSDTTPPSDHAAAVELVVVEEDIRRVGAQRLDLREKRKVREDKAAWDVQEAKWAHTEAERHASVSGRSRQCPTCTQDITPAHAAQLAARVPPLAQALDAAQKQLAAVQALATAGPEAAFTRELEDEERRLRMQRDALKARIAADSAYQQARERQARLHAQLEGRIRKLQESLREQEARYTKARKEVDTLEACALVLGAKGLRAHLLGRVLSALQALTNLHLARLYPGVTVEIKPSRVLKSGEERDEVGLVIKGDGDGSYATLSDGNQRVLDYALWRARRQLVQAALGEGPPIVELDEVFEGVHVARIPQIVEDLREMAKHTLVLVTAHSRAFVDNFVCDQHWVLEEGQVRCV